MLALLLVFLGIGLLFFVLALACLRRTWEYAEMVEDPYHVWGRMVLGCFITAACAAIAGGAFAVVIYAGVK